MKIQILKNETFNDEVDFPKRATSRSTGNDIITTSDPEIVGKLYENSSDTWESIDYIQYRTNLKLAVQAESVFVPGVGIELIDYDVLLMPRSSVSKYNLILANCVGLCDADYRGEILLRFKYLWQPEDFIYMPPLVSNTADISNKMCGKINTSKLYKKGDKVCQLKATRIENIEFMLVTELDSTDRKDGGFGSTDIKKSVKSEEAIKQMTTIEALYNSVDSIPVKKKYSELIREREQKLFN